MRENMAKADIRASPREISRAPVRVSARASKRDRISWKRESAESSLRAFLAGTGATMGKSFCQNANMGRPVKNSAKRLYEGEAQNAPFFIGKFDRRELLSSI